MLVASAVYAWRLSSLCWVQLSLWWVFVIWHESAPKSWLHSQSVGGLPECTTLGYTLMCSTRATLLIQPLQWFWLPYGHHRSIILATAFLAADFLWYHDRCWLLTWKCTIVVEISVKSWLHSQFVHHTGLHIDVHHSGLHFSDFPLLINTVISAFIKPEVIASCSTNIFCINVA